MTSRLIALVEYDNNLRQSIALILFRAGYGVTSMDCFSKIDEILPTDNYQLIIADINLPGFHKSQLNKMLEQYPAVPAMILTDQLPLEDEEDRKQFRAHYLIKPIDPEVLLAKVDIVLKK
jgi:DNA-binding response OmpR family regulator